MNSEVRMRFHRLFPLLVFVSVLLVAPCASARTVVDAMGRTVTIPETVERVICSGSGSLRLLTYLGAQDLIVAVDSIEKRGAQVDARPYAIANPQFKDYPLFGEFRGFDNPELIVGLDPQPQVILKTYATSGHDPIQLQEKTGIPVVVVNYGNLTHGRADLNAALRIMAEVVGKAGRAEEVIAYFDAAEADLRRRAALVSEAARPSCYVGGLAMRGGHGFRSTEPAYAPFAFLGARNVAASLATGAELSHADVSKEQIIVWDPEIVFLDVATTRLSGQASGLEELRTDPAYAGLSAANKGRVYGVLPYNSYTQNFDSILANAYFIGKTLYPEAFADVEPVAKADEIYTFLVGKPVFDRLQSDFEGMVFAPIKVRP
jgi:iron complex transport system substrate-binding protein